MNQSKGKINLHPLDRVGWLARQSPEFRAWAARNGRWCQYAAGESLSLAGDEPDGMYGLAAGALEVTFPLSGEEPVTVHRAEPGFWIGEAALMANATRLVSLSAALDSRVFHIPVGPMKELLQRDPAVWRILYEQSFDNLTTAVTLIAESLSLSPRARIAKLLLRLADSSGQVSANQDDFGRVIGMTRSSVRRAIASLVESGVVRTGYRTLEVIEPDTLAAISREA